MSASLVGSEMCIRDRRFRPVGLLGRQSHPQDTWASSQGRPRRCAEPRLVCSICLLYTSDAADDM
eukprot:14868784-Alexandrium_andersonii.AAC.1